jgi:dipeptidase E
MRLFLTSSFIDVVSIFESFENPEPGKKVAFIPTASLAEEISFFVDEGKEVLEKLGLIVNELEISTASEDEIKSKLTNSDYIYVAGGNTFFLLQELKKKNADKIIVDQIVKGKLYIGESAGSIVAAPNIDYSKHMDDPKKAPELTNYDALNLVDFYTVPHYGCFPFEEETQTIVDTYSSDLKLITIGNDQAILVDHGNITIKKA